MATKISISPLTRIEGHLSIFTDAVKSGASYRVTRAECHGEMFRGFEKILQGRHPLDAQQITQRICGVCPISHGIASCRTQEMAYSITPKKNGRLVQNLILAANYLQSHVVHFYALSALDFVDVTAVLQYKGKDRTLRTLKSWVEASLARSKQGMELFPGAPFLPRYEGDYVADVDVNCALVANYVESLNIRKICHEMTAIFGAKVPHSTALVPGGCTQRPTLSRILAYQSRLKKVAAFVEDKYHNDILTAAQAFPKYWEVGGGYGNLLSYGVFEMNESGDDKLFKSGVVRDGKFEKLDQLKITEQVAHSHFSSGSDLHPSKGETEINAHKDGAYSWLKAPRYGGQVMEVGPLARVMASVLTPGENPLKDLAVATLKTLNLPAARMHSVLGRHACRLLECLVLIRSCHQWLEEIDVGEDAAFDFDIPKTGAGVGLTEAPRGALGHWLDLSNGRIGNYQCIVPTTWNCSPRDDAGNPGAVEKALEGVAVKDPKNPLEVARVVRSFDPCLACAVH